jgi:hypothetical protein
MCTGTTVLVQNCDIHSVLIQNSFTKTKGLATFSYCVTVAARSKAWVCGGSLAGIPDSNPVGASMSVSCECVCCQVEVSSLGLSLDHTSPNQCGVSEYDHEASTMKRSWPTRGCCAMEKKKISQYTQLLH